MRTAAVFGAANLRVVNTYIHTMASAGLWTTVVPGVLYSVLPIQSIEVGAQVNSVERSVTFVTQKI